MKPEELEARIQSYINDLEASPDERVRVQGMVNDCEIGRILEIYKGARSGTLRPLHEVAPEWMDDPTDRELFKADQVYFSEVVVLFSHYLEQHPNCLFLRPNFLGAEAFHDLVASRFFRLDFFDVDIDVVETTILGFNEERIIIGHPDPELERFFIEETLSEPLKFFVLVQSLIHSVIYDPYAPNGRLFNYTWASIWAEIDARYDSTFALDLLFYFEKYEIPYLPREVGFVEALHLHPDLVVEDLRDKGDGLWLFTRPDVAEDLLHRMLKDFETAGLPVRLDERDRHIRRRKKCLEKGLCISREFDPSKIPASLAVATLQCVVIYDDGGSARKHQSECS